MIPADVQARLPASAWEALGPGGAVFVSDGEGRKGILRLVAAPDRGGNIALARVRLEDDPEELLRLISRLVSRISHDLGGGLASVMAAMDIWEGDEGIDEDEGFKEAIREQMTSLSSALRVLRLLAYPTHDAIEEFDLGSALEQIVEIFRKPFQRSGVRLTMPTRGSMFSVTQDIGLLQTATGHLLENAREACGTRGEVRIEVREELEKGRRWLVVLVLDEGPGLPLGRLGDLAQIGAFEKHGKAGLGLLATACAAVRLGGGLTLSPRKPRGLEARIYMRDGRRLALS